MSQTIPPQNLPPPMRPTPLPMPPRPPGLPAAESARVAKIQAEQLRDIHRGLADGSLTQAEASKLLGQQARVSAAIGNVFEDGKVTTLEKLQLMALQAEAKLSLFAAQLNGERGKPVLDPQTMVKQSQQIETIAQGLVSGEFSGREAASLLKDQAGVAQTASDVEADGQVDWLEQFEVRMEQAGADMGIAVATQNLEKAAHGRIDLPPRPL